MAYIQWSDEFSTGNFRVDAEHKELFRLVNTLHDQMKLGKGKDFVGPTLKELAKYVIQHFAHEELLMKQHRYIHEAEHKEAHVRLTKDVRALVERMDAGENVLSLELFRFLADWLRHHIEGSDKKMVAWIRKQEEARL